MGLLRIFFYILQKNSNYLPILSFGEALFTKECFRRPPRFRDLDAGSLSLYPVKETFDVYRALYALADLGGGHLCSLLVHGRARPSERVS